MTSITITKNKRFPEWIVLKEKLDLSIHESPLFNEGEVWWCSIGENVGREISGKSQLFSRPVLVFRKLSRQMFLGIPTTSQIRTGSWYVPVQYNDKQYTVVLAQMRVFDTKRMSNKIGKIDSVNLNRVRSGFESLFLPKIIPPFGGRGECQK
ncbi:MAG: type II toxin-antitoxin system PemK/MazF family toxin [Patescibacteria group bacterium]|nr:type II toxin-antitoxin system PemK/MazF family toxin [Patescibacteria group bacterium]